jgi:hypothetical protein
MRGAHYRLLPNPRMTSQIFTNKFLKLKKKRKSRWWSVPTRTARSHFQRCSVFRSRRKQQITSKAIDIIHTVGLAVRYSVKNSDLYSEGTRPDSQSKHDFPLFITASYTTSILAESLKLIPRKILKTWLVQYQSLLGYGDVSIAHEFPTFRKTLPRPSSG